MDPAPRPAGAGGAGVPPIAAVDVGSNSIQLTLARLDGGRVLVIDRIKDPARLGAALGADGRLDAGAARRAVATLRRFRAVADEHGAVVRATGTAALRAAKDGPAFVQRVADEAGITIELISGAEEGRLVLCGVLHGLPALRAAAPMVVDVGGGSTELIFGRSGRAAAVTSVPLGSLVVARRWLGLDPVARSTGRAALRAVARRLERRAKDAGRLGFTDAVGTGGSIQRIARIALALEGRAPRDRPLSGVHGYRLERAALRAVVERLMRASTVAERQAIPGMDPERADTLLGGALVFEALAELLGLAAWTVSMDALRTGLIVDAAARVAAARAREGE